MNRKWTLASICLIVPLGFYTKFYSGPGAAWVNNSLGGVFYVIFWCLLIFLILKNSKPVKIVTGVFIATSILEFAQLWHPHFLEWLRSYFFGRTILGTSFSWIDFVYYFVGAILSWIWLTRLNQFKTEAE